jgi:hypothetical protein
MNQVWKNWHKWRYGKIDMNRVCDEQIEMNRVRGEQIGMNQVCDQLI